MITHLDHVALRVPDPEAAAAYYGRLLGLGITGRDASSGAVCVSTMRNGAALVPDGEVVLSPGSPAGMEHYALAVPDAAALAAGAEMLRARGLEVEGPKSFGPAHGPSVRLRDVDGYLLELVVPRPPVRRPSGPTPADLVRLSHLNLRTTDAAASARWWQDVMGLRLSDQIPETFYWLRCGREHATIALLRSPVASVHHIAFEIASWEDVRQMLDHFTRSGVQVEFGPGRHGPGHSIFVYFVDALGIRWELQAEAAQIADESTYQPGVWDPVRGRRGAVNLWGPPPPPSFL
jgi:catechol 2,3-dioxygenase-like lactoylglutathione lyase family enzyme